LAQLGKLTGAGFCMAVRSIRGLEALCSIPCEHRQACPPRRRTE